MRKQFNLQDWLTDTSQKVVDENGRPVRIICTDADGLYPIIGLVDNKTPLPCGKDGRPPYIGGGGGTLFIVTPEPELTEFEKVVKDRLWKTLEYSETFRNDENKWAQELAAELLSLAINARAREMDEILEKSKLDKDSIPYNLIEFMCNLYTCQNWKEIEETAEAYATRIKAAAMKDLPRWRQAYEYVFIGQSIMRDEHGFYFASIAKPGCLYITCDSLEKLPGFNE